MTTERQDVEGLVKRARELIGAKNDMLTKAQRESNVNEAWHLLGTALESILTPPVESGMVISEGWVLVPKEPTKAMKDASWDYKSGQYLSHIYERMLSASPNYTPSHPVNEDEVREVTDDMVERACEAFFEPFYHGTQGNKTVMRIALEAALSPVSRPDV